MRDVRLLELLEGQWNRVSLTQMQALGYTRREVSDRVLAGRLRAVHQGVFAGRPFLDDERGRWMAATLTALRATSATGVAQRCTASGIGAGSAKP
jgi:hypothetical protein